MPPKRSRKRAAPSPSANPRDRHAHEVREAFRVFAVSYADALQQAEDEDDEEAANELEEQREDEHGVLRVLDVRRALKSLNLPPPPSDFFDEGQRFLNWDNFQELADTMRQLGEDGEQDEPDAMDVDEPEPASSRPKVKGKRASKGTAQKAAQVESEQAEMEHAFALFTTSIPTSGKFEPGPQDGKRITVADLRRVARELREDVDDSVLKMMVLEANGGEGNRGVVDGVGRSEFEAVMKRAGVFA